MRTAGGKASVSQRRWFLTLPWLWTLVSLACIFVILNLERVHPHDFWWHVRAGQWILDNGRVPAVDLFSYTRAGQPWAYQSWLMEVVLYSLYRLGDLPLVILFNSVVITAAYGLLLRVNQWAAAGDLRWASLATVAAAALILLNHVPRPQTISVLLFVITLFLIERDARRTYREGPLLPGDRALWWLPLLFALWANCHGGFIFGLALLGTYVLSRLLSWLRKRHPFPGLLALVTVFTAAATLLSPLGTGMVDYVLGFFRHPITRTLNTEFWPPTVRTLDGVLFFGFSVLIIVLLLASGHRLSPRESLRLLLFGGLALFARRNVTWFGIVAAPTLAACLVSLSTKRRTGAKSPAVQRAGVPGINLAILLLVGLLTLLSLPWLRPYLPLQESKRAYVTPQTPVDAVAFLRTLPEPASGPRHVFHSETSGSYMTWAVPNVPVFIDTRIELYPEGQWRDYLALNGARHDWQAILGHYGVDTLLLERERQAPLIEAATASPGWQQLYEDEQAVIIERRENP
ncbi:hypothetical protein ACFLUM_01875 [Chloroflexota bacterium]